MHPEVCPFFWIDTDGYTDRDRLMFLCGVEFEIVFLLLRSGWSGSSPIQKENASRIRMLCGYLRIPNTIEPYQDSDSDKWSKLTIPPKKDSPLIHEIPTIEKAHKIMDAAYLNYAEFHPLIFDLAESLDPNDVEVRISKCETCDRTVHYTLGDNYSDTCPRCHGHVKVLVDVPLVIQGSVIIHTGWRKP